MVSIIGQVKGVYHKAKRDMAENVVSQALNLLGHTSQENYRRLAARLQGIANTEQQKKIAAWIAEWLSPGNPGAEFLSRVLKSIHPNVRKNYIAKSIVNLFFRDPNNLARLKGELGSNPPATILISPTMRCNYRCVGCYAGEYDREQDLPFEVLDRVITEAKAMGTKFFSITGGEPFVYRPLLDIFKKHHDCAFQVYTNGSLIDEEMADKLVELGNVCPCLSLEGFREETDARRGEGAFDRVMKAMDNLRERGGIFAFSCTVNRENVDVVSSDEFIDFLIGKGVAYGWYFLYMPVGRDPDLSYQPTPAQRNQLRQSAYHLRKTKPILLADFWGDSVLTGGCIAGGRIYCHINHRGDLEPCIFCHFTTEEMSIVERPLLEALKAPFLMAWRRMQPFNYNTLRPCPIVDHPRVLRAMAKRYGARSTDGGGESLLTDLKEGLDRYSKEVEEMYTPTWEEEYPWAKEGWLDIMDLPKERIDRKKAAYKPRIPPGALV